MEFVPLVCCVPDEKSAGVHNAESCLKNYKYKPGFITEEGCIWAETSNSRNQNGVCFPIYFCKHCPRNSPIYSKIYLGTYFGKQKSPGRQIDNSCLGGGGVGNNTRGGVSSNPAVHPLRCDPDLAALQLVVAAEAPQHVGDALRLLQPQRLTHRPAGLEWWDRGVPREENAEMPRRSSNRRQAPAT